MSTDTHLTEAEKDVLLQWLRAHNGSLGPDPVSDGAGGIGGLWSVVEQILGPRLAELWDARDDLGARLTQAEYLRDEAEDALADFAERAAQAIEAQGEARRRDHLIGDACRFGYSEAASVVRELGRTGAGA